MGVSRIAICTGQTERHLGTRGFVLTVVVGAGAGGRAVPGGLGRDPAAAVGQQGSLLGVGGVGGLLLGAGAAGGDHGEEERGERGGPEGEERGGHACSSQEGGASARLYV
jgi:hypothetical protein